MDIIDVRLFLSLIETNNISKTADILHFSQSTVSYRLKNLEKDIGVPLFYRGKGKNNTMPTTYGEQFISVAKRWEEVWQETQDIKHAKVEQLSIASIDSISSSILSNVYQRAVLNESPVQLKISTHQSWEIYDLVDTRETDMGFVSIPQNRKNIITVPVFTQKYYVVRYSQQPTTPKLIDPASLDPEFEIFQSWGTDYDMWHESVWGSLSNNYYVWIDSVSLIQTFLTDERYWTIMPDSSLRTLYASNRMLQIDELEMDEKNWRVCYMIVHSEPKPSRRKSIERFRNILYDYLKELEHNDTILP